MIKTMQIPAHIKYIAISILFIIAAVNFTRTTLDILKSSQRLDSLNSEVELLESNKAELVESIEFKKTNDYVEERARNDLNLVKPGEKLYVVEDLDLSVADSGTDQVLSGFTKRIEENAKSEDSNIHKWFKLFFN